MKTGLHSALTTPQGVWWLPAGAQERKWVIIAFVWCMILFAMMPLWHWKGGQNPSGRMARTTARDYAARCAQFNNDYAVKAGGQPLQDHGIPVVAPPPGAEVYLMAQMWQWTPVLRLERGATYHVHLSSMDLNHGFGLYPLNLNLQVLPGYDYALDMTPNEVGDFRIICNEFCGIGHHTMVGKIEVVEPGTEPRTSRDSTTTAQLDNRNTRRLP